MEQVPEGEVDIMTRRMILVMTIGMLLCAMAPGARAAEPERVPMASLRAADSLFRACRWEQERTVLLEARTRHPRNAELLWRLANSWINEGDALDGAKAEACYTRAIACAEEAIAADASNANAHAMHAAALGSLAMFAGGREKVRLTHRIREALDRALALDGSNQIAHTIYGTWHREVADVGWIERKLANLLLGGLPDGSFDASVRHFKAAIRKDPTILRHHCELGMTYAAMDRPDLAAASYRTALACRDSWSTDQRRRTAMRKFLAAQQ
jgi:tetratricopeptide (TPR) repeat protein